MHHVTTHYVTPDGKRRAFQGYVPGQRPTIYPDGIALFVPRGSRMQFSIHYTPIGEERTDQLAIGSTMKAMSPSGEGSTGGGAALVRLYAASKRRFNIEGRADVGAAYKSRWISWRRHGHHPHR